MRVWHHLVIEGPAATVRSFVAGVLADRGLSVTPRWGDELGLEHHSLAERMKELLLGDHHEEVFLAADVAEIVAMAIAAGGAGAGLRLTQRQVVRGAHFTWTAETASREAQHHIRERLVGPLPADVTSHDLQENEQVDPSVEGTSLYTVAHGFEYRGSGRLEGTPPGILDLYAVASSMDFVRVSPLAIEFIPI